MTKCDFYFLFINSIFLEVPNLRTFGRVVYDLYNDQSGVVRST